MTPKRALITLIFVSTILRLAWAATLPPGNDEAYFALYAKHLDWSYFDHPPMIAWMSALGLTAAPVVPITLAMRLAFVLLFGASTWLLFKLTTRFYSARTGVLAAFLFTVTGYFGLAAGAFALPDGPLLFFWLATLDRTIAAIQTRPTKPTRMWPWLLVGLCWGLALLSKYHAVLLPVGIGLFLLLEPRGRVWLRRPGPYLAFAVGLIVFAPVIGWNAAHGWESFRFQAGRAVGDSPLPQVDRLAMAVGGQVLYAFPWIWLVLFVAVASALRAGLRGRSSQAERFLLSQAAVPLVAFLLVGCWQSLLPHWSLVGLLPLFPLAGERLDRSLARRPKLTRARLVTWSAMPVLAAAIVASHTHLGVLQGLGLLTPARDPSLDLYGWREVTKALVDRQIIKPSDEYLFTSKWYHSSQLAFALDRSLPVLCYSGRAALGYAQWSDPRSWVGGDGILAVVNHSSTEPAAFDRWFERIEPLGSVTVERAGAPVKIVQLFRCMRQTQPFPYADAPPAPEVEPSPAMAISPERTQRR